MARILISAGHTNMQPGQIVGKYREADITRKLAEKVYEKVKLKGNTVLQVPFDLPWLQRITWINNTGYKHTLGDICIEIHLSKDEEPGVLAWYGQHKESETGPIAEKLVKALAEKSGYKLNGAIDDTKHPAGKLEILRRSNPHFIMLAPLGIDIATDQEVFDSEEKLNKLSDAIAESIIELVGAAKPSSTEVEEPEEVSFPPKLPDVPKPARAPLGSQRNLSKSPFGGGNNKPFGGGLGGIKPGGLGNSSFGGLGGGLGGGNNAKRDETKKLVSELYEKILGRKPENNETNYFANAGTSKEDLTKKILDSAEFKKNKESAAQIDEIKRKLANAEADVIKHKSEAERMKALGNSLTRLVNEKNTQIAQLIHRLKQVDPSPHHYLNSQFENNKNSDKQKISPPSKPKNPLFDLIRSFIN